MIQSQMLQSCIQIFFFKGFAMSIKILMPALSPTMEEGKLAKWNKKEGDQVNIGDIIAEIETDKATMEIESVDEGVIGKILVKEGTENIKVNSVIAILLQEGETLESAIEDMAQKDSQSDNVAQMQDNSAVESKIEAESAVDPVVKAAPMSVTLLDPDIPAGTEMVEMTVREALRQAIQEEMRRDEDVFLMGEEVAEYNGAYKVSQGLLDEFGPRRVIDTPITEHGFAGLAVGAAFTGLKPILEFMTFNFSMQAIDHIVNSAAKTLYMSGGQMGAPIVFRGPNGAAARVGAQHSQCYAAWYGHIPGLKVVMPCSAADAKGLLKSAIRDPNPVIFLENELLYGKKFLVPQLDEYLLPIGKARIERKGKDVTVVACGMGMVYACDAADILAKEGIDVELIDLRTIRPLDLPTVITSVKKTGRCVTVEEGFPQSSVGKEVATLIMQEAFDYLDAPILTIAGKDVPMPYAANLEKLALPSVEEVVTAVKSVMYKL
ncbi:pyruvate dehydrogenase complex E1 component subunit beta [Bartonella sp. DGB1]|uniref:pyruvate dehydrogenase complex E1 component subunit beta n=1 Tax=Bartonella sp. DGB1 TaxID=3239807 RepID=UPI0035248EDE